jgi:primosomal protein N' (replication factor Y)
MAVVGCRVLAPLGKRTLTGFIVESTEQCDVAKPRMLYDILDQDPVVSQEMLRLATWLSEYYMCSLGEAIRVSLPAVFFQNSNQKVFLSLEKLTLSFKALEKQAPRQAQILRLLSQKNGKLSLAGLRKELGAQSLMSSLNVLQEHGFVEIKHEILKPRTSIKTEKMVRLVAPAGTIDEIGQTLVRRAPKQRQCLEYLAERGPVVSQRLLMTECKISSAVVSALARQNLVEVTQREISRNYYAEKPIEPPKTFELTTEQENALRKIKTAIRQSGFNAFLLYGVTGSGKTQVYIEAIKQVIAMGLDAIVLVPEISLTPQTVQRFRSHFGDAVAVMHSAMSDGERFDSWRHLKSGEAKVAIGPRSAIFAPVKRLGLVVVDEEHESSYKQAEVPRYHARDLAVVRAQFVGATVILGSATPSGDSFYNAQKGKYQLCELRERPGNIEMPEVRIVDMLKERRISANKSDLIFSKTLVEKIREKISLREQIILLLNRRGFSSHIKCHDCGFVENCEYCNITLTYHLSGQRLRCHYCGYSKKAPEICRECGGQDILFHGLGTQKVEDALHAYFPEASVIRMDLDTTSKKRSHDRILESFGAGKYNILLGTQMVAKGLDFSRVTLVGVINADVGMLMPDFRASERCFQLLTQVAGRAGRRATRGEVIIQTYSPDSFTLNCVRSHNYDQFFSGEIMARRELGYPPFSRIACLLFRDKNEEKVRRSAQLFAQILRRKSAPFVILGPVPAPITKIRSQFRHQILIKSDKLTDPAGKRMRDVIREVVDLYRQEARNSPVKLSIDIDPVSIL